MISLRVYPLLLLLICFSVASAQSVSTQIGARVNGIGYASATLFDSWSLFNNPAGAAKLENTTAGFTYDLHPTPIGANRTAALIAVPVQPIGVITGSVYRFGDNLYNEHVISAGFASKFGLASLGIQVNYIQYSAEGFGNKGVATVNLGGIAELTRQLSIGAYIVNINQPKISGEEKLPTKLVAGLGFKPIEKVFVAAEIEKDLEFDPTWKMGIEYAFHKKFSARTGYNIRPNTGFFGLGFKTKKFTIDYALQYNALLSLSHQASIGYQFAK
jgi:hypothetical protein